MQQYAAENLSKPKPNTLHTVEDILLNSFIFNYKLACSESKATKLISR